MNIEDLMRDEAFMAAIEKAEDLGDVADIFARYGIEVTPDELYAMQESAQTGELDEESLEDVAGGSVRWRRFWPLPIPRPMPLPLPPRWPRKR